MELYFIPPWELENKKKLFNECIKIREEVFIQEQAVPPEIEQDGLDSISRHFLLRMEGKPVATMRTRGTDDGIKFERIAVLKEFRGFGYGKMLINETIKNTCKEFPKEKIYLHAQQHATSFYESLGFIQTGEKTIEAGISHITMFLTSKI